MAITFSKNRDNQYFQSGFNNNIVEFSSDDVLDSVKCTISIPTASGNDFVITPDTSNVFTFNFLEGIRALISGVGNFSDNLTWSDAGEHEDLELTWNYNISFKIEFTDTTTETVANTYEFLRSILQIGDSLQLKVEESFMHENELCFFKGYPYDISILNQGADAYSLVNLTHGNELDLTAGAGLVESIRLIIDNGQNAISEFQQRVIADSGTLENNSWDTEIVDLLNIGINKIRCYFSQSTIDAVWELKDVCDGVYLKWFNRFGSWSYWLFEAVYQEQTKTKITDIYNTDFESIENTIFTKLTTGKTSIKERTLQQTNMSDAQFKQVSDILTSQRVEIYTGEKGGVYGAWQSVILKGGGFKLVNTKRGLTNIKFTIEINDYN